MLNSLGPETRETCDCVMHANVSQTQEYKEADMSDFRPSCFCGRIICTECELLVLGIEWLIIHIARDTLPTF